MGSRYGKPETLLTACAQGDEKIIRKVIQKGKVSCSIQDSNGRNPLHLICICDKVSEAVILGVAQQLISYGCTPNGQDKQGNTPLHYCAKNCYRHVVRMFAMRGAHGSVFIQNNQGLTPRQMVEKGNVQDYDSRAEISHLFMQIQYAPDMDQDQDDQ